MRAVLLSLALICPAVAVPADLPSIDKPLKTGLSAKSDAAVVIGVEDYPFLSAAPYAERDAQAMYDFLVYTRGIPSSRVALLVGGNSRTKIVDAVRAAGAGAGPGATVWVYFAGHGTASPSTSQRLVLPANTTADEEGFDEAGIPVSELQQLATAGGAAAMVITDACFTGAGRDGGRLLTGGRGYVPPKAKAIGAAVLWDAALENQVAGPIDAVQHGAFTYFAIGAMRGWADGQVSGKRDGVVTSEEAQLYVADALKSVGMRDQTPSLVGSGATERTLVSGSEYKSLEKAPELAALDLRGSAVALVPVGVPYVDPSRSGTPGKSSGGSFGALSIDVDDQVREQECTEAARVAGAAARASRLAAEVKRVQGEAKAVWTKLGPQAETCAKLTDTTQRSSCAKTVDTFVTQARAMTASVSGGTETSETECGARSYTFKEESRSVPITEIDAAVAMAAKLRVAPVVAQGTLTTVSASSGGSKAGPAGIEWIALPGGSFRMGSETGESDEKPVRTVALSAFYVSKTEVTVAQWGACVTAGGCTVPATDSSYCNWGKSDHQDHPVNCVDWNQSVAFAKWAGGRLLTEAEWEYAARSGGRSQAFPWGGRPRRASGRSFPAGATVVVATPRGPFVRNPRETRVRACATWLATSGNGRAIGTRIRILGLARVTPPAVQLAPTGWPGVVPGTASHPPRGR